MEIDFNAKHWDNGACPKIDCRKDTCKCGLKKVFLPSVLGDDGKDSPIAPKNGAYCNTIVVYEANGHIYIYSKEGIPTLMTSGGGGDYDEIIKEIQEDLAETEGNLAQEILDRGAADDTLQQEIDDIKNSPDVVDIVPTYAALQSYDTSKLGDNDIIRVLQDEQHDGQSTYYRWNKQSSTWTYIGAVGDYYTKGQVDTLLADKQDKLTAGTNVTITQVDDDLVISATDTTYTAGTNVSISSGNVISATDTTYSDFVGTDGIDAGTAGLVPAPAITDVDKFLKSDGTWDTAGGGGGDTVYSDKSTSNVANGGAVYIGNLDTTQTEQVDPTSTNNHYKYFWALPYSNTTIPGNNSINILGKAFNLRANNVILGAEAQAESSSVAIGGGALSSDSSVAIGFNANSAEGSGFNNYSNYVAIGSQSRARNHSVAIGKSAICYSAYSVIIGDSASTYTDGTVALGAGSYPTRVGEVNIGSASTAYGFNSTNYRVIGGVHDGQDAQDAVTVNQVNSVIDAINTALSTNIPHIGA